MSIENNKDLVPSADVADGQIGKEQPAQVAEGNLKDSGKKLKAAKADDAKKQKPAKSADAGEVIENLRSFDPFAEVDEDDGEGEKKATKVAEKIEIRIQQRNGRKTLTTVTNIPKKWNLKKICKQAKKRYNCNGTVIEDEEHGQVIQLQGDQRNNMHDFLCGEITNDEKTTGLGFNKDMVRVHGF